MSRIGAQPDRTAVVAMICAGSMAVLMAPTTGHACSCLAVDIASSRSSAVLVFEATLRDVTPVQGPDGRARGVFRLSRVWKGTPGREVTVMIPAQPSMCPPHFELGQRYIVYATGTAQALVVTNCARYAAGASMVAERRGLGNPIRTFR